MKKSDFISLPKKAISAFKAFPKKQQIIFGAAAGTGTIALIVVPVASSIASRSDNKHYTYKDSTGTKVDLSKKYFKANDKYFTSKDDAIRELKLGKVSAKDPIFTNGKKYDKTLSAFGIIKLTPEEINALKVAGSSIKVDNVLYTYYFEQTSTGNLDNPGFFETQPHDKAAIPFAIPTSLWTDGSGNYFTTEDKALDDAKVSNKIIDYTSLPTLKDGDKVTIDNKDYFYFDTSAGGEDLANAGFFSKAPTSISDAPVIKDADVTLKKDNNYFTTNNKAIESLKNDTSLTSDKKLVDFDKTNLNLKKGDKITLDGAAYDVKEYLYSDTSINLDHPGWRLSTNVPSTKDDDNLAPNVWYGKLNDGSVGWTNDPLVILDSVSGVPKINKNQDFDLDSLANGQQIFVNEAKTYTYYDAIPVATPGWYKVDTTFPAKNDDLVSMVSPVYNDGSSDQYFTTKEKLLTANGIKPYVYNAAAVPSSFTVDGENYTYKTQQNNASFKATTAGWYPVSGVNDSSVGPSYTDLYSVKDSTGADFVNADKKEVFWAELKRIVETKEYDFEHHFWYSSQSDTIISNDLIRKWVADGAPETPFTRAFSNERNAFTCNINNKSFEASNATFNSIISNYNPTADEGKNLTYNGVEYKYFNLNDEVPLTPIALVFYNDQNNVVPNPLQNIAISDSANNFFSDSDKALQHFNKISATKNGEDVEGEVYLDGEPVKWMKYYDENISPGFYSSVPTSLDGYPDFDGHYQYWTNLAYGNNSIIVWTSKDELWNTKLLTESSWTKKQLSEIPTTDSVSGLTYFEHPVVTKLGFFTNAHNSADTQPDITLEAFNPKYQMGNKFYNDDNAVISDAFQATTGVTDKTGDVLIDNQPLKYYEKTSPGTLQVPGLYLTRPEGITDNGQKYETSQIKYSTVNGEYETTSALALDEANYHKNLIDSQDHKNKNIDGKQYIYFDLVAGENLDKPGFFKVQPTNKTKEPELTSKLEDIYKSNVEKEFFTTESLSMQHDKITTKTVGYFDNAKKNYLEENFLVASSIPLNEKEITLDNKKYYWK